MAVCRLLWLFGIGPAVLVVLITVLAYNIYMQHYTVEQDYTFIEQDHERVLREMTLPDERYRAVIRAEQFLKQLCDPKQTARVPSEIRVQAAGILRHFPTRWEMQAVAERMPALFQEQMEDLHRTLVLWEHYKNSLDNGEDSQV